MRIGLVGCVKGKLDRPAPARDLYTSDLFAGRRKYVERTTDRWYVLSALHGLVRPDDTVEPYDHTLNDASTSERREWSGRVLKQLEAELGDLGRHDYELHAGRSYWAFGLREGLESAGATVEIPTEGMRFGEQLRFYKGRDER